MTSIDRKRTGKTGVAFGLVRSRDGGRDVNIVNSTLTESEEIQFPFLLGTEDRDYCFECIIGEDIGYNEWTQFIPCIGNEIELFYTREARGHSRDLPTSQVGCVLLYVEDEDVNDDAYFFISKKTPDTIDYIVAVPEDIKGGNYQPKIIYSIQLK